MMEKMRRQGLQLGAGLFENLDTFFVNGGDKNFARRGSRSKTDASEVVALGC